jgi:superfamily II DNA/RNA helicase
VAALQGNLSQNARERVMAGFRSGAVPILLATNVAARGLDVPEVGQVINFELPESAEWFTHRAGRTGRMGRAGRAITLLAPEDGVKWRQFEKELGQRLERRAWSHAREGAGVAPRAQLVPVREPARKEQPLQLRASGFGRSQQPSNGSIRTRRRPWWQAQQRQRRRAAPGTSATA